MTNKNIDVIIGQNLKFLVKTHFRKKEDFTDDYGVGVRNLNRWYKGEYSFPVYIVQELAEYFDVSFDYFLTEHPNNLE